MIQPGGAIGCNKKTPGTPQLAVGDTIGMCSSVFTEPTAERWGTQSHILANKKARWRRAL